MPYNAARRAALLVLVCSGASLAMVVLMLLLPSIERRFMPVVVDVRARVVERYPDGSMGVLLIGNKARCDCAPRQVSMLVEVDGEMQAPALVRWPRRELVHRDCGPQSFGVVRIYPASQVLDIFATHSCHSLWTTTTRMGRWRFDDDGNQIEKTP